MFIGRVTPLGNDAFPAFTAGTLPGMLVGKRFDAMERWLERKALEKSPSVIERAIGDAAVVPEHVEDVVPRRGATPRQLTVENQFGSRQGGDGGDESRVLLREAVA